MFSFLVCYAGKVTKKCLAWFFQSVTDGSILGEAEDSEKRFLALFQEPIDSPFFLRQMVSPALYYKAQFIQSSG
jgi:hypothetical protein